MRDVSYRVVSAQLFPDHTSIARFRKEHGAALEDLFPKILLLCKKAGLAEAEMTDREKNRTGEEHGNRLPKALAKKAERKSRIRKCLADLEAKAERLRREKEEKAEKRTGREEASGPLRGRKPQKEAPVDPEALKANTTDPESRIMGSRKEGSVQAYNAQIVVTED
ncbi:MAG: hypothetical protein M1537_05390 [Nitrospirae bacterium]|nr:hypothetical protein [Nitrospirota bacterium]MCL5285182.1 hypothetical protein [Nitrospirota bacterium]